MPDETDTVPVTPAVAADVVREIQRKVGSKWRVMPIGGTRMGELVGSTFTTKDIDLVLLVVTDGAPRVATTSELLEIAARLGTDAVAPDPARVKLRVATRVGPVLVELIRGAKPGKGGYFPTTRIFEAVAATAAERDGRLDLPAESLAFLKAWAADDKGKRIRAGHDPDGHHAERLRKFQRDVASLHSEILDEGRAPKTQIIERLLGACPKQRATDIRRILRDGGWRLP